MTGCGWRRLGCDRLGGLGWTGLGLVVWSRPNWGRKGRGPKSHLQAVTTGGRRLPSNRSDPSLCPVGSGRDPESAARRPFQDVATGCGDGGKIRAQDAIGGTAASTDDNTSATEPGAPPLPTTIPHTHITTPPPKSHPHHIPTTSPPHTTPSPYHPIIPSHPISTNPYSYIAILTHPHPPISTHIHPYPITILTCPVPVSSLSHPIPVRSHPTPSPPTPSPSYLNPFCSIL